MMRKNFMKRLSKSASDISGCTKKTHSTSPDEEEKETNFRTPPEDGASEDDDFYDEETRYAKILEKPDRLIKQIFKCLYSNGIAFF